MTRWWKRASAYPEPDFRISTSDGSGPALTSGTYCFGLAPGSRVRGANGTQGTIVGYSPSQMEMIVVEWADGCLERLQVSNLEVVG